MVSTDFPTATGPRPVAPSPSYNRLESVPPKGTAPNSRLTDTGRQCIFLRVPSVIWHTTTAKKNSSQKNKVQARVHLVPKSMLLGATACLRSGFQAHGKGSDTSELLITSSYQPHPLCPAGRGIAACEDTALDVKARVEQIQNCRLPIDGLQAAGCCLLIFRGRTYSSCLEDSSSDR